MNYESGIMKTFFRVGFGAFISLILYFTFIIPAYAAVYFIESPTEQVKVGQEVELQIGVDTEGERINVFNVALVIPEGLEFRSVVREQSAVNIWVQEPIFDEQSRKLTFIGGVPGGASGKIVLLSVLLRATKAEDVKIDFNPDSEAYLNDGFGTVDKVQTRGMALKITEDQFGSKAIGLSIILLVSIGVGILIWQLWRKKTLNTTGPR